MHAPPRPRLVTTDGLLAEVSALARTLDREGQDLWAANLRACLTAEGSAHVFAAVGLELSRLRDSFAAHSLRLTGRVDALLRTLHAAVGPLDGAQLSLYVATRDLVDALRLGAGPRWAERLEETGGDVEALDRVLACMVDEPGAFPGGVLARIDGLRRRLARADERMRGVLSAALRPPLPI